MNLPENITLSKDIQASLKEYFNQQTFDKVAVLVDENTKRDCYPLIKNGLPSHFLIEIASGEKNKTLDTCTHIWSEMTKMEMSRKSLLINLGGGVIGDMGGFCARTFKRGISFINIPSTLLAQVDASVGGKLAVDFQGFKNHIGVFSDPDLVLIDTVFLKTLPEKELVSGFAEILKHGLIADKDYWEKTSTLDLATADFENLVSHSVAIKTKVVTADPTEKGLRKILNFGHTLGHAIESFYLDGKNHLLHGEAIAAGMITEAWLSVQCCQLSKRDFEAITKVMQKYFPKVKINPEDMESILDLCYHDKKNQDGKLLYSLLPSIGACEYDVEVSRELSKEALALLQ